MTAVQLADTGMPPHQRQFADRLKGKWLQRLTSHCRDNIATDQSAFACGVLSCWCVSSLRAGARHLGAVSQCPDTGVPEDFTMLVDDDAAVAPPLAIQLFDQRSRLDTASPDHGTCRNLLARFQPDVVFTGFRPYPAERIREIELGFDHHERLIRRRVDLYRLCGEAPVIRKPWCAAVTDEQITLRILNGAYNMPAFASSLKPDELAAIVAFLDTRKMASDSWK